MTDFNLVKSYNFIKNATLTMRGVQTKTLPSNSLHSIFLAWLNLWFLVFFVGSFRKQVFNILLGIG